MLEDARGRIKTEEKFQQNGNTKKDNFDENLLESKELTPARSG
jgi:hypothetical protein